MNVSAVQNRNDLSFKAKRTNRGVEPKDYEKLIQQAGGTVDVQGGTRFVKGNGVVRQVGKGDSFKEIYINYLKAVEELVNSRRNAAARAAKVAPAKKALKVFQPAKHWRLTA